MTLKVSRDTVVNEVFEDVCQYWGCHPNDYVLYKGEENPVPFTQVSLTVTN